MSAWVVNTSPPQLVATVLQRAGEYGSLKM